MRPSRKDHPAVLEDVPNIGKAIAADLRNIGIIKPDQLADRDPLATFVELSCVMGHRHDPCVLYTLIAARHFMRTGEALPWWKFTEQGRRLLERAKRQKI